MHFIVYTSECAVPDSKIEQTLKEIDAVAKQANLESGITGVLFYDRGRFLQALEGQEHDVRRLYEKIATDPRHRNPRILVDEPVEERSFADWSMDTFYIHSPDTINEETLCHLRSIYDAHFKMNSKNFISFLQEMIDKLDIFKILHKSYEA